MEDVLSCMGPMPLRCNGRRKTLNRTTWYWFGLMMTPLLGPAAAGDDFLRTPHGASPRFDVSNLEVRSAHQYIASSSGALTHNHSTKVSQDYEPYTPEEDLRPLAESEI